MYTPSSHSQPQAPSQAPAYAPPKAKAKKAAKREPPSPPPAALLTALRALPNPTPDTPPEKQYTNGYIAFRALFNAIVIRNGLNDAARVQGLISAESSRRWWQAIGDADRDVWNRYAQDSKRTCKPNKNSRAKKRTRAEEKAAEAAAAQQAIELFNASCSFVPADSPLDSPSREPSSGRISRASGTSRRSQTSPRIFAPRPLRQMPLPCELDLDGQLSGGLTISPATSFLPQSSLPSELFSFDHHTTFAANNALSFYPGGSLDGVSAYTALPFNGGPPNTTSQLSHSVGVHGEYSPSPLVHIAAQGSPGMPHHWTQRGAFASLSSSFTPQNATSFVDLSPTTSYASSAIPLPAAPNALWAPGFDESSVCADEYPALSLLGDYSVALAPYHVNELDSDVHLTASGLYYLPESF